MNKKSKIVNFIAFQIGWFSCALGAVHGWWWIGPLVVLGAAALDLALQPEPKRELALLALAAVIGFVVEGAMIFFGVFRPLDVGPSLWIVPVWLNALWINFAATLNASLAWLKRSPVLAVAFGALGGPAAYYGGAKLGAIELSDSLAYSLGALAVVWALATPALLWLADRLGPRDGQTASRSTSA
jgi:hypothetical protein